MKLSAKEFDRIVNRAIERIPSEIRQHLENISISVQRRPSRKLLKEMGLSPGEPLLGLYQGVSLMERSVFEPPLFPDTVILFQEPLESICTTSGELERQIEITVVHEIAHFLGFSDEELTDLGYD
jgi:predicted Zn-dependent protease with MMP-like domain